MGVGSGRGGQGVGSGVQVLLASGYLALRPGEEPGLSLHPSEAGGVDLHCGRISQQPCAEWIYSLASSFTSQTHFLLFFKIGFCLLGTQPGADRFFLTHSVTLGKCRLLCREEGQSSGCSSALAAVSVPSAPPSAARLPPSPASDGLRAWSSLRGSSFHPYDFSRRGEWSGRTCLATKLLSPVTPLTRLAKNDPGLLMGPG